VPGAPLARYALVLSRANDVADDLVQATCLRAIERADQFIPGTRLDRWLFAILGRSGSTKFVRAGFAKAADSSTPRTRSSLTAQGKSKRIFSSQKC